jgi:hypothetical protein
MISDAPGRQHDLDHFFRILARIGVAAMLAMGIVRAGIFLAYGLLEMPAADQPYQLEGACVYFARCVEQGLPLYPEGTGPSYTVNYMGPCYFALVGLIGRLFDADIPTLYVIGRVVTFLCGIGPAVIAAVYLRRRCGRLPALVGLAFGIGSAPMIGFGVMTRPDMMADLLGAAGFFMAFRKDRLGLCAAAALLTLAFLTKQTAGAWLLAAVLALLADKDSRRRAFMLGGATVAMTLTAIGLLAAIYEPAIVSNLFGQGAVAFDPRQRIGILMGLIALSPEMLFFAFVGCGLWMSRQHRDIRLLILTMVWLAITTFTCAKRGSDLNYFIPLRMVEALAAGTLCAAVLRAGNRPAPLHRLGVGVNKMNFFKIAIAFAGAIATLPSTIFVAETTAAVVQRRAALDSEAGRADQKKFERLIELAKDPRVRLMTDSERLAVYQGSRAVFFDAFLFRLQVDAGQLHPRELIDRLNSRWYSYVVLSADVSGDYNDFFFYRLPADVATAVKANYRLQSREAGLYVYVPQEPRK